MVPVVNNINSQLQKLSQLQEAQKKLKASVAQNPVAGAPTFKDVLQQKVAETNEEIKFSSHAEKRLTSQLLGLKAVFAGLSVAL